MPKSTPVRDRHRAANASTRQSSGACPACPGSSRRPQYATSMPPAAPASASSDAFGEQLANQPSARGAERQSHRNLPLPCRRRATAAGSPRWRTRSAGSARRRRSGSSRCALPQDRCRRAARGRADAQARHLPCDSRICEDSRSAAGVTTAPTRYPPRAACWNTPSRLPSTCCAATPGFSRPTICSHQYVAGLADGAATSASAELAVDPRDRGPAET